MAMDSTLQLLSHNLVFLYCLIRLGKLTSIPLLSMHLKSSVSAAAAILTTGSSKATCTFGKGAQNTSKCHVVTDIRERKNVLRIDGRCYYVTVEMDIYHVTVNRPSSVSLARDVTMSQLAETGVGLVIIAQLEIKRVDL